MLTYQTLFRRSRNLTVSLLAVAGLAPAMHAQIEGLIPIDVPLSDIVILLEEYTQVPNTANNTPKARINHVKPMGDGSGRVLTNDLNGKMHLLSEGASSVFLDFKEVVPALKTSPGLGTGFTSFDFHPLYATNGIFYTAHSENKETATPDFTNPKEGSPVSLQGVILEWTMTDPAANAWAGTKREVLRVDLPGTIHGFQEISFNPNSNEGDADFGKLYICIGDGGTTIQGNPENTSRLDSVLGTILRIDPLGTNSANGQYGVPDDNPWASDNDPDTYGEIWAYGFRNPHRISWDTAGDGLMFTADIGERNVEEVNLVEPGRHYGWNVREGTFVINPDFQNNPANGTNNELFPLPDDDATLGFTYPVAQYDHFQGNAIVGGYVYRGTKAPHLYGKYLWGEIVDGRFYFIEADDVVQNQQSMISELRIKIDGTLTTMRDQISGSRTDLQWGYDEDGELFVMQKNQGTIYRVVGSEGPDPTPPAVYWVTAKDLSDGDAVVTNSGPLVEALNLQKAGSAPADFTVNGVLFQGGQPGTTGTDPEALTYTSSGGAFTISGMNRDGHADYSPAGGDVGDWAGLSDGMKGILTEGQWSSDSDITVTLNDLTPGKSYLFQLFFNDSRDAFAADYSTTLDDGTENFSDPVAFNTSSGSAANGGVGQSISGVFVADETGTQLIVIGGPNRQLNAIQLREYSGGVPSDSRFSNLSTRTNLRPGALITPGFVVEGDDPKTVLVRMMGPGLSDFGVESFCADPSVTLYRTNSNGTSSIVATNDNWNLAENSVEVKSISATVGAWPFKNGSADSAILITLDPGVYTAQGTCVTEGDVVAEVYIVD